MGHIFFSIGVDGGEMMYMVNDENILVRASCPR